MEFTYKGARAAVPGRAFGARRLVEWRMRRACSPYQGRHTKGDMGDAQIPCSLPELLNQEPLARLRAWHQGMRQRHPIRFKGKRAPP